MYVFLQFKDLKKKIHIGTCKFVGNTIFTYYFPSPRLWVYPTNSTNYRYLFNMYVNSVLHR